MTKHYKLTVALLATFLSASFYASAATAPPKVVFIGDWLTYYWPLNNPNWINEGIESGSFDTSGSSANVLARFQADVVSLHPNIVHIMVGSGDAQTSDDALFAYVTPAFLQNIEGMVAEAKAANIQVVFGLEPQDVIPPSYNIEPFNSLVVGYAAQNNIPVINYGDALCQCVSSIDGGTVSPYSTYLIPPSLPLPMGESTPITPAGYAR